MIRKRYLLIEVIESKGVAKVAALWTFSAGEWWGRIPRLRRRLLAELGRLAAREQRHHSRTRARAKERLEQLEAAGPAARIYELYRLNRAERIIRQNEKRERHVR